MTLRLGFGPIGAEGLLGAAAIDGDVVPLSGAAATMACMASSSSDAIKVLVGPRA